jgi:hypothetical protein
MLTLTVAATLSVLAPLSWLLIESTRRRWLAFAIPALVALPLGFYSYGQSLLGYAIAGLPQGEVEVIYAAADEASRRVHVLIATPNGPRLHSGPLTEQSRKQAGAAQAALERGLPVRGRAGGDANEGEFVFYVLPPMAQPKG